MLQAGKGTGAGVGSITGDGVGAGTGTEAGERVESPGQPQRDSAAANACAVKHSSSVKKRLRPAASA